MTGKQIHSSLDPRMNAPVNGAKVVANIEDRNRIDGKYRGMWVYVEDVDTNYVLVKNVPTNLHDVLNWITLSEYLANVDNVTVELNGSGDITILGINYIIDSDGFSIDASNTAMSDGHTELPTRDYVDSAISGLSSLIGQFQGDWDASGGLLPTTRTNGDPISAGDYRRISIAGDIVGLSPESDLVIGDVIMSKINNPAVIEDRFSMQGNIRKATLTEAIEGTDNTDLFITPQTNVERVGLTDAPTIATLTDEANWSGNTYTGPALPNFYKRQRYGDATTRLIYEFDGTTIYRTSYTDKAWDIIDTVDANPNANVWEHIRSNSPSGDVIVNLPDNTGGQLQGQRVSIRKESSHDGKVIPSGFNGQLINGKVTKIHLTPDFFIQYDNPVAKGIDNMSKVAKIGDKIYSPAGYQVGLIEYDTTNRTSTHYQIATDLTCYSIVTDGTDLYVTDPYGQHYHKIDPVTMTITWTRTPPSGYRPATPIIINSSGNLVCMENHYAWPSSNSRYYLKELRASDGAQIRTSPNLGNQVSEIFEEQGHYYCAQVNAKRLYKITNTMSVVGYISYATSSNHNFITTDHQYLWLGPIQDGYGMKTFDIATRTLLPDMGTKGMHCPNRHFGQSRMYGALWQSPGGHEGVRDFDLLTDTLLALYNITPYRPPYAFIDDVDDEYMRVNSVEQNQDGGTRGASFRLWKFYIGPSSAPIQLTSKNDNIILIANADGGWDIHSNFFEQEVKSEYVWKGSTSDNTPTDLYVNGKTGERIPAVVDTVMWITTEIFATNIVTKESNTYIKKFVVKNDGGTVSVDLFHGDMDITESDIQLSANIVADDLTDSVRLVVEGHPTDQVNREGVSRVTVLPLT